MSELTATRVLVRPGADVRAARTGEPGRVVGPIRHAGTGQEGVAVEGSPGAFTYYTLEAFSRIFEVPADFVLETRPEAPASPGEGGRPDREGGGLLMARKKQRQEHASVQGTLFGPTDAHGGAGPAPVPVPREEASPPPWDDGLTPPTAGELAALHAAHPGALLLFRHPCGCAFHGADAEVAHRVAGLPLCGPPCGPPYAGWAYGDFPGPVRKLLRAGHTVAVVERGEGLPPGHRLGAEPVVTPFTAVEDEEEGS